MRRLGRREGCPQPVAPGHGRAAGEVPQFDQADDNRNDPGGWVRPAPSPTPTPLPPLHGSRLTDAELRRFRELAHELDVTTAQVRQSAEQSVADYRDGGRFVNSLTRFAENARGLHVRSDEGQIDPNALETTVAELLAEARRTDGALRQVDAFPMVWQRWARTIAILNEMSSLFR